MTDDRVKMSIVCTIQMLNEKLDTSIPFEQLWSEDYVTLWQMRERQIREYNKKLMEDKT